MEEGRGPRVPRSRGPKDQDISNSHSNTNLTLKKVHLVQLKTFYNCSELVTACIAFYLKRCRCQKKDNYHRNISSLSRNTMFLLKHHYQSFLATGNCIVSILAICLIEHRQQCCQSLGYNNVHHWHCGFRSYFIRDLRH